MLSRLRKQFSYIPYICSVLSSYHVLLRKQMNVECRSCVSQLLLMFDMVRYKSSQVYFYCNL